MPVLFEGDPKFPADDEIATDVLYPTEVTAAEQTAGYVPAVADNPKAHLLGQLKYIHILARPLDETSVRVKTQLKPNEVRYSNRNKETFAPEAEAGFKP